MSGPLLFDRVMETSTTTGTGTYTLAGAVTGYQAWSAVGNANTAYYCAMAVDGNGNPSGGWEVGLGTYTSAGTTLARTTVLASTNGGAAVNWTAGTRRIFLTFAAAGVWPTANGGNKVAQVVSSLTSAVNSGTTRIPIDDTIPQITEGDEYMTLAITPQNANSTLVIDVVVHGASSAASTNCFALFQDATANALAAAFMSHIPTASAFTVGSLRYTMTAGTTFATTFRVRAATNSGTFTFNGAAAARLFGAIPKSSIVITEILP